MNQTQYAKLAKPLPNEKYDIEISNSNMDIIDSALEGGANRFEDVENTISNHTSSKDNPHKVTISQLGFSNVEDKSSEMIRDEITKENVTTALEYTPYTPEETDERFSALLANIIYPNAGSHNSIYRGKNLGTYITDAQYKTIREGTFEDMYIGDYWDMAVPLSSVGSTTWNVKFRIAAFDYYYVERVTAYSQHHIILVPDYSLIGYMGRYLGIDVGCSGYYESSLRDVALQDAISNFIMKIDKFNTGFLHPVQIYLVNKTYRVGDETETPRRGGEPMDCVQVTSAIELMSESMVYGQTRFCNFGSDFDHTKPVDFTNERSQLPLFSLNPSMIYMNDGGCYRLRDVCADDYFLNVDSTRMCLSSSKNYNLTAIRPYICIG